MIIRKFSKVLFAVAVVGTLVTSLDYNYSYAASVSETEKFWYKGYGYEKGIGELDCCGDPYGDIQENGAATIAVSTAVTYGDNTGKARLKTYTRNGIVKQWYSRNYVQGNPTTFYATSVQNDKIVTIFTASSLVDNFITGGVNILPNESSTTAIPEFGWVLDMLKMPSYVGALADIGIMIINSAPGSVEHTMGTNNRSATITLRNVAASKTEIPPEVGVATMDQYTAGNAKYDAATRTYQTLTAPKSIGAVSHFLYNYEVPTGETRVLQSKAKAYYEIQMRNDAGANYRVNAYTRLATHNFTITGND